MKYAVLLSASLFALALGCNTAQLSQPAPADAGPPCAESHPAVSCDAGAPTPGACPGLVSVVLDYPDASNTVPAGSYPLGCTVSFFVQDQASAQCNRAPACTCLSPDAGPGEGGADAGASAEPGVWDCFPQP